MRSPNDADLLAGNIRLQGLTASPASSVAPSRSDGAGHVRCHHGRSCDVRDEGCRCGRVFGATDKPTKDVLEAHNLDTLPREPPAGPIVLALLFSLSTK